MREEDIPHATAEPSLRTGKVRELTGLSDRQMHEWDKRGALPSQREGTGHRRSSAWEVIALRITRAMRDRYGIPLGSLAPVCRWMLGLDRLEGLAGAFTFTSEGVARTPEELEVAREMIELAKSEPRGNDAIAAIMACHQRTMSVDNPALSAQFNRLASFLVPLYSALGEMTTGFPVYLVTNLELSVFVPEPSLSSLVEAETDIEDPITLRVDGHINEILRAMGGNGVEPHRRAREIQPIGSVPLEEQERIVVEAIRSGDFETIEISPNKHGFKVEITREHSISEREEVARLIESQDYQTVLVTNRRGEIARVTQKTTHLVPGAANGKNPPRPGDQRSGEDV